MNVPHGALQGVFAGQSAEDPGLQRLADLLAGSRHNLVARSDRAHIMERHIAECDALASRLQPRGRWMDLGTGGGLPGLVLALRHPDVAWILVDATAKKVEAVRDFAAELGLRNVTVVQGRAESLAHDPAHRGRYEGVVSRALAQLPVLVELCRGFVRDGGRVVAMKGPAWRAELERAQAAMRQLRLRHLHSEQLPVPGRASWVVTMQAEGPPPAGFPRRDGIPKAQPLAEGAVSRETRGW